MTPLPLLPRQPLHQGLLHQKAGVLPTVCRTALPLFSHGLGHETVHRTECFSYSNSQMSGWMFLMSLPSEARFQGFQGGEHGLQGGSQGGVRSA